MYSTIIHLIIDHHIISYHSMKTKTLIIGTMLAAAFCAQAKKETITFRLDPPMTCHNCEAEIKEEIRFEKGVKKVETSLDAQTITLQYDDKKTSPLTLAKALEKMGYKTTPVTPTEEPKKK